MSVSPPAPRRALLSALLALAATAIALGGVPALAEAAGTWNGESYLASPLREATGPSIAVTTTGAAVAGWQAEQGDFGNVDAFLATRDSGTAPFATGGTRLMVDSAKAHTEGDMGLTTAVNPAGKAVVAWVQATFTGNFLVQAVVRPAGSSTFGPVQTLTAEGEDAGVPAVAMNAAGATVLVWRRHEAASDSWQVQGAELTDSGTTFSALNGGGSISSDPDDGFPELVPPPVRVAIAPSGAAVVTWDSTDDESTDVARWARRGPGDAAFGAVHELGDVTLHPDVAASDDGTFSLTWVTGTGGTGATASLARASTADFDTPTPVGTTPGSFLDTRVGMDAAGNSVVALTGTTEAALGAHPRVAVTRCATASTCSELEWLSDDSQTAEDLDLAVNAAGDAVAAWSRSDGTRPLIEASLLAHGGSWDDPVFISGNTQSAYTPTVGIDGDGNVTAAWMAANAALWAVRQTTGAVEGASVPPTGPGSGDEPKPTFRAPIIDRVVASVKQGAKVTATKSGRFSGPKITCSEAVGQRCKVAISFTTTGPKPKRGKAKKIIAARAKLTVPGGKSATPKIKLGKPAKALLRSRRKLVLDGTVVINDSIGNRRSFPVKTTVKAPAEKKKKKKKKKS